MAPTAAKSALAAHDGKNNFRRQMTAIWRLCSPGAASASSLSPSPSLPSPLRRLELRGRRRAPRRPRRETFGERRSARSIAPLPPPLSLIDRLGGRRGRCAAARCGQIAFDATPAAASGRVSRLPSAAAAAAHRGDGRLLASGGAVRALIGLCAGSGSWPAPALEARQRRASERRDGTSELTKHSAARRYDSIR